MKIGIYGRVLNEKTEAVLKDLLEILNTEGVKFSMYKDFATQYRKLNIGAPDFETFADYADIYEQIDFMFSLGGDGTLLDTITFIRDSQIPICGINTGRLGFLAGIARQNIREALEQLIKGRFSLDQRSLLCLESDSKAFSENRFALNDLVIYKNASSSMIVVHTYLNGEFLNSYWSDGLIVSTPTGSTGYSLSCGGPILFPRSSSFAITPIAPHNLNVRPVIVSDENVISFEVEGRARTYMASLDSRSEVLDLQVQLAVRKADFNINLVRFDTDNYLFTLRDKLMWGIDNRN